MSRVRVTKPDLSKARPPVFAWRNRIVVGYMNLLLGEEGVGKGTLACWLIRGWTRGALHGAFKDRPINVGIVADEDAINDTWTPRLHAAGADLNRVGFFERPDGGYVSVTGDRSAIAAQVRKHRFKVLFFDALLDNLGADVDVFNQKKVREALKPLRALARELNVAVVGTLHPNKRGRSYRELSFGSGFNAVGRSNLWLAQDPDDPDMRLVVRGKGNLSKQPQTVAFRISESKVELNGHAWSVPRATDFFTVDTSLEDLLDHVNGERLEQPDSKRGNAREAIRELLPRDGEWHDAGPIIEAAGVDARIVREARKRLGVESRAKPGTFPATHQWRWGQRRAASSQLRARSSPSSRSIRSAKSLERDASRAASADRRARADAQQKLSAQRPRKPRTTGKGA